MRKPPIGSTAPKTLEEEEERTVPGSQNAGLGLAQALSTWPVRCKDDPSPPPAWDPTELQIIDSIPAEDVLQTEPPAPQRGLLVGVARFLRQLRELPGRRSSRGGDPSGQ